MAEANDGVDIRLTGQTGYGGHESSLRGRAA